MHGFGAQRSRSSGHADVEGSVTYHRKHRAWCLSDAMTIAARCAFGVPRVPIMVQPLPPGNVDERKLPTCVREALDAARAARPECQVTCVAFRTIEGGTETVRLEPQLELVTDLNSG